MARRKQPTQGFFTKLKRSLKKWLCIALFVIFVLPFIYIYSLKFINPWFTPLMVQRLFEGYGYERQWRDLEQISQSMPYAVIAAEDNKFCQHTGFDFKAIRRVLADALRGERPAGASTISMQTSKNLLLWPARSIVRKLFEAYYTIGLELILDKRRIIELYLNSVEFGPGLYGVEAASQHYFKRSAQHLTPRQATQLAAVLPAPLRFTPATKALRARRYEQRITQLGAAYLGCVKH